MIANIIIKSKVSFLLEYLAILSIYLLVKSKKFKVES